VKRLLLKRPIAAAALLMALLPPAGALSAPGLVAGHAPDEALRLGERMYREGLRPNGEPLKAMVQGDIEIEGTMFTCESCHLRSGLGSFEGTVITLPTNAGWLYSPILQTNNWRSSKDEGAAHPYKDVNVLFAPKGFKRPAYTDETLATALRTGTDPAGRVMNKTMPRYQLTAADAEVLIYYLKNLSDEFAPGVDENTLKLATIVAPDAAPDKRESMLVLLEEWQKIHNAKSRRQQQRISAGPFWRKERYTGFRDISIKVWELSGERSTWYAQLERFYREEPVFALVNGISGGSWEPMHRFAEDYHIPSLFPITEQPVVSPDEWYTLYFSKGVSGEGESAARYLRKVNPGVRVTQVYREGGAGEAAAKAFTAAWAKFGMTPETNLVVDADEGASTMEAVARGIGAGSGVYLLWLGRGDLAGLYKAVNSKSAGAGEGPAVIVSRTLVDGDWSVLAGGLRARTLATWPRALPKEVERRVFAVNRWLKMRGIEERDFDTQAAVYFNIWMLSPTIDNLRNMYYREYMLEIMDMMTDQTTAIALYPRMSFGPGQRYASKACYVVKITGDARDAVEPVAGPVIH